MREFHHVGIVTTEKHKNETYIPDAKAYITDFETHPYRVEWVRHEPDSPVPEVTKKYAHVAFKVDNLDAELKGQNVIIPPFSPFKGMRAAFILTEDGAPIELMQFDE